MPLPGADPQVTAEFAELCEDYWDWLMEANPTWATNLGDYRYNDRLPESGAAGRTQRLQASKKFRERLRQIDASALSKKDRVSHRILGHRLAVAVEQHDHNLHHFGVDQMFGVQIRVGMLHINHPFRNAKDVRDLVRRYEAYEKVLHDQIADLQGGLKQNRTSPRIAVERVLDQLERSLAVPAETSPLVEPVVKKFPKELSESERDELRKELIEAVDKKIHPGLRAYRDFLKTYTPRKDPGIGSVPGGKEAYRFRIRQITTLPFTPEELHEIGRQEIASIREEMAAVAKRIGFDGSVPEFIRSMMERKEYFGRTGDQLLKEFEGILSKCNAKLPEAFGRLPKLDCVVKPIEKYREQDAVAAFYHAGSVKTGRPGVFYVNTYQAENRPTYNMRALCVHEAVPGHHLQIAIANEQEGLPMFRRHGGVTAFVEGWALYSERLADELGLYPKDEDRFGMLTYQAWRASRLVVDTGMHALGWSRDRAIEFMKENLALSETEILNEIDRYIIWPGQALAYKVGQREIERLRSEAQSKAGDGFDLRRFHDRLLENGGVPLPVLREILAEDADAPAAPAEN